MERTFACVQLLLSLSAAFAKYVHILETKNWQMAQEYCRRYYTDLAPISNRYDMERLRKLSNNNSRAFMWIGMQRNMTNTNEWTWSGGGVVSTSLWELGQPNNRKHENYGVILDYKLHDVETTHKVMNFFCYNAVVVRERKTWEEALEFCRRNHSDLASVASETEMMLIQKELNEDKTTAHVWIGLRFFTEGWLWVDRQPLGYEAWGQEGKAKCPDVKRRCAALQVTGGMRSVARSETITHQVYGTGSDSKIRLGIPGVRVATGDVKVKEWEAYDCAERLHFVCY